MISLVGLDVNFWHLRDTSGQLVGSQNPGIYYWANWAMLDNFSHFPVSMLLACVEFLSNPSKMTLFRTAMSTSPWCCSGKKVQIRSKKF